MAEKILNDHPDNRCFGCSPHNPAGLQLLFSRLDSGEVETRYEAPEHFAGAPGILHGGIQAAILDEALGHAAHADGSFDEDLNIATVDFRLRYRRPVPTGKELRVVGRLLRVEGRDFYMEGEIQGPGGEVLTRAEARWRRLGPA